MFMDANLHNYCNAAEIQLTTMLTASGIQAEKVLFSVLTPVGLPLAALLQLQVAMGTLALLRNLGPTASFST